MFQAIDAGGEYDVPQARPGTPPERRVHTLAQDFTVQSTLGAAVGIGLALRCLAPRSRSIGERYIGNLRK